MQVKQRLADPAARTSLRAWLEREAPRDVPTDLARRFDIVRDWQRRLYDAGWLGLGWPEEYGGAGGAILDQLVFNEELVRSKAPHPAGTIGLEIVGPTIVSYGTEVQKQRLVKPMLRGDEIWCQGFSEPNAGSDLGSLQTRAEPVPGGFKVNGRKTWTSWAQYAQWCALLARTDPSVPKHKGISYLLVEMDSPGVEVFPLVQMTGDAEFGEVAFQDVFVPEENVLGPLNGGWHVAMNTLAHERGPYAVRRQLEISVAMEDLRQLVQHLVATGRLRPDALLQQRIGRCRALVQMLEQHSQEVISAMLSGEPGEESSIDKLLLIEVEQSVFALAFDLLGAMRGIREEDPRLDASRWTHEYLYSRAASIYGGSAEIQRGIVGQRVLGLPRA
jgi:alkylation response protein AidB-like acyl-CoA dehydrogenase